MKALISYKDWLLKIRGQIEPKVGDKIVISGLSGAGMYNKTIQEVSTSLVAKNSFKLRITSKQWTYIDSCYVKIDFPEINWRNQGKYHQGYLNNTLYILDIFPNTYDDSGEYGMDINNQTFTGSLEDCKEKANKILFNL